MAQQATAETTLRSERNRFVAFAFAAAEVFLEVDRDFVVRYAAGATQALLGASEAALNGTAVAELGKVDDGQDIIELLRFGQLHGRFGPRKLRLTPPGLGHPLTIEISGTFFAQDHGCFYLALRRAVGGTGGNALIAPVTTADPETVERFVDVAIQLAETAGDDEDPPAMTLLELDGLSELQKRLAPNEAAQLDHRMAALVDSYAMQDGGAVRLADDKFGLLSAPNVDLTALPGTLENLTKAADPEGLGTAAQVGRIDLGEISLDDRDNARALQYAINRFCDENEEFTLQDLAEGYQDILNGTKIRISALRAAVHQNSFDVVFQPIVELQTRELHHYEALVRLTSAGAETSPAEFIKFAEDTGLIIDFDIAMCGRIVERINRAKDAGQDLHIAVNLSGRSLENDAFVKKLSTLVRQHAALAEQLMFEITESVEMRNLDQVNNYISWLRQRGHEVCLDDFGTGAAAFQYLRAVDVDYVKIDGSYVRSALAHTKDQAFLRSVAGLCNDLGIKTIAEMVEDEQVAAFLRRIGVTHAQGYLYGKPSGGLKPVNPPPN